MDFKMIDNTSNNESICEEKTKFTFTEMEIINQKIFFIAINNLFIVIESFD